MPTLASVIGDTSFPIRSGDRSRELDDRLKEGAVNIAEMPNFVGNGTSDDIIPVEAAIAKALSEGKGAIIRPAGADIGISRSVFLGFAADQTNAAFSLALISLGGRANHNQQGGEWKPLTQDFTAIKVGPGQMMMVANQAVRWAPGALYRRQQNPLAISFAVAAEGGGTSGFKFVNCHSLGGHTMFAVGAFGAGSLADSGLFDSCSGTDLAVGYDFRNSQAYIQTIINNRVDAQKIVFASLGHNVALYGGNYSGVSSRAKQFTIANVSTVTPVADGGGFYYPFTAEVTDPDPDLENGSVYDDAVIDDVQFGLIPLTITNYNAGTNTLSLETWRPWSKFYGQATNLVSGGNLQTRLQAATTIGLGERLTTFKGSGINQAGTIHLENGAGYTRFFEGLSTFDGGTTFSSFENIHANYDLAFPADVTGNVRQKLTRSHPFIYLSNGSIRIRGMRWSQTAANGATIPIDLPDSRSLEMIDLSSANAPTVRVFSGQHSFTNNFSGPSSGLGAGVWDPNPFVPMTANSQDVTYRTIGWNRTRHRGWLPEFDRTPRLVPAWVTTLEGTLPTFTTGANVSYPLLAGGQNYSIGTPMDTDSDDLFIKSKHKFYSYGQDLTTTNITNLAWSFYGKTCKLVVNVEAFERLFPGLGIFLSHASISGGTPFECIVTSISKVDLCVYVAAVSGWVLPGTAGTQYTGTTIGQAAYSFKKVTGV